MKQYNLSLWNLRKTENFRKKNANVFWNKGLSDYLSLFPESKRPHSKNFSLISKVNVPSKCYRILAFIGGRILFRVVVRISNVSHLVWIFIILLFWNEAYLESNHRKRDTSFFFKSKSICKRGQSLGNVNFNVFC